MEVTRLTHQRIKSSIYLNEGLHERAKALSKATSLSLNTHIALALEEYLQDSHRAYIIERELTKPSNS